MCPNKICFDQREAGKGEFSPNRGGWIVPEISRDALQEIADRFKMGHYSNVTASANRLNVRIRETGV